MWRPWYCLPPQLAHDLSPLALRVLTAGRLRQHLDWRPLQWRGLQFHNRLGIAGGVDKNATQIEAWWRLGAGFVEIGTVTPRPQGPNPGRILRREISRQAVWNKMGFPNAGAEVVRARLANLASPRWTPIFVNVGKNRETGNAEAASDYAHGIQMFKDVADAFVINISSPNTKGLRELLQPQTLRGFLAPIVQARTEYAAEKPLLLKLSPDSEEGDFLQTLEIASELGMNGFILTNTTLARESGLNFPAEGGVSGHPLAKRAKHCLRLAAKALENQRQRPLLISAGGILSADEARERLDLGADLLQVYAALIFHGPNFFRKVARQITQNQFLSNDRPSPNL